MNVSMTGALSAYDSIAAQMPPPPPPPPGGSDDDKSSSRFSIDTLLSTLDSDSSGGLSMDELSDSALSNFINEDNWADIDSDGDGALSASELRTRRDAMVEAGAGLAALTQMATPSAADPMAMFESLIDQLSPSGTENDTSNRYAEDLYSAMGSILNSRAV
ncbi:hypothetical protein [Celeribacter neptunius]|uniref:EF hand n=1 Tax=Celeribacter neptunius TaxID=588602 RepID=A0A1I3TKZ9_9RHOB|nr:hypothetical protein [Celeribacter neptunius]SFJ71300.1 EF hand [Celeribacter neptunius]